MKRILSFEDYTNKANEADLFGVTTGGMGNYPAGYEGPEGQEDIDDSRGIDPSRHNLKLIATDYNDFAVLEDKDGKKYIFYIDTEAPNFDSDYKIYDEQAGEYLDLDDLGVEAAANDVPEMEIGFGADDWIKGEKTLVGIDEELADDLVDDFKGIVNKGDPKYRRDTQKVMDVLIEIAKELKDSNESVDYEESETDGTPGDEESETDETTEVMESEGIHPAIREKLMDYLKDNKDATYAEAKKHIGDKIAGWKLSEEDFEEAKKSI
jgi:hypothetical protein|tara:strand:+ start:1069 stop:1866 length:798 start_codon:yes stop_codon:yes gene_type:complete